MHQRDYRDVIGGGLLTIAGVWIALHSLSNFSLGTVSQMGPGMFPTGLGILLTLIGIVIGVPAIFRPGALPNIDWRPFFVILLSLLAFGLLVTPFGMVPAVAVTTIISMGAGARFKALEAAVVAAVLCALAYLIFRVGFGIHIEPFRWPL